MKRILFLVLFFHVLFSFAETRQEEHWPMLKGIYFGQKVPLEDAEVFLDGVISRMDDEEMCGVFTMDGKEFYYNAIYNGNWTIFVTKEIQEQWTKPEPMAFTAGFTDRDFTMSPDGNKILFGSNRGGDSSALDIYITTRQSGSRWSDPVSIGSPVNTVGNENYPSIATNGNLYYFTRKEDGLGGCDIYFSRYLNGGYQSPENLGSAINSDRHDWDAYIAPDESYIIFSSKDRDDTIGGQDLYICFKNEGGRWLNAKNMGPRINSPYGEICPGVSLDGKLFFFTSRRRGKADILWISAKIINELKPKALSQ